MRDQKPALLEEGYKAGSGQFRKFTCRELKKATGNFKDELGNGGSGALYKGVLDDARAVSVKEVGRCHSRGRGVLR